MSPAHVRHSPRIHTVDLKDFKVHHFWPVATTSSGACIIVKISTPPLHVSALQHLQNMVLMLLQARAFEHGNPGYAVHVPMSWQHYQLALPTSTELTKTGLRIPAVNPEFAQLTEKKQTIWLFRGPASCMMQSANYAAMLLKLSAHNAIRQHVLSGQGQLM